MSFSTLVDDIIHNIRLGLRTLGILFCVAGLVFPDVSKQNGAFIFKVRVQGLPWISGFHHEGDENCGLLGHYAAYKW